MHFNPANWATQPQVIGAFYVRPFFSILKALQHKIFAWFLSQFRLSGLTSELVHLYVCVCLLVHLLMNFQYVGRGVCSQCQSVCWEIFAAKSAHLGLWVDAIFYAFTFIWVLKWEINIFNSLLNECTQSSRVGLKGAKSFDGVSYASSFNTVDRREGSVLPCSKGYINTQTVNCG